MSQKFLDIHIYYIILYIILYLIFYYVYTCLHSPQGGFNGVFNGASYHGDLTVENSGVVHQRGSRGVKLTTFDQRAMAESPSMSRNCWQETGLRQYLGQGNGAMEHTNAQRAFQMLLPGPTIQMIQMLPVKRLPNVQALWIHGHCLRRYPLVI